MHLLSKRQLYAALHMKHNEFSNNYTQLLRRGYGSDQWTALVGMLGNSSESFRPRIVNNAVIALRESWQPIETSNLNPGSTRSNFIQMSYLPITEKLVKLRAEHNSVKPEYVFVFAKMETAVL